MANVPTQSFVTIGFENRTDKAVTQKSHLQPQRCNSNGFNVGGV